MNLRNQSFSRQRLSWADTDEKQDGLSLVARLIIFVVMFSTLPASGTTMMEFQ